MSNPTDLVLCEQRGAALWLTLNRPQSFNALSEELMDALDAALQAALKTDARAVVLAGAGKAFCAGHDLKQMRSQPSLPYYQRLFTRCSDLMLSIQQLPLPVIARVHGIATAAGCQLVASCDLAVAADDARFATSGINVGLFCSTPAVALSRNMPRKQALEMLLTGEFISAVEAARRGLINHAMPLPQLDQTIEALVESIAEKPASAVALGKQLFYQQHEMGTQAAYQLAAQTMACNMMDASALEGVQAFIDKRAPLW